MKENKDTSVAAGEWDEWDEWDEWAESRVAMVWNVSVW